MSSDAYADAPVVKGPVRARRIDPQLKLVLARMLADGTEARTASQLRAQFLRARGWKLAFNRKSVLRGLELAAA
eukprot:3709559-Lingulodinium_polyedra.AAC.1